MVGNPVDFGFLFLELADVREDGNVIAEFSVGVAHGGDAEHFGELFPFLAPVLDFTTPEGRFFQMLANALVELFFAFAAVE